MDIRLLLLLNAGAVEPVAAVAHLTADAAELPVPVCRIEVRILFEILLDHHRGECTCCEQCEQRNDFFSC